MKREEVPKENDKFIEINGSVATIKSAKSAQDDGEGVKQTAWRSHLTLTALLLANLHNNMDKYTIASKSYDQHTKALYGYAPLAGGLGDLGLFSMFWGLILCCRLNVI